MRALKAQFFLSYAIVGSLMPLLSIFLRDEKGFDNYQIGIVMACISVAAMFSPILITLLADLRVDARRMLACSYGTTALVLLYLNFAEGFFPIAVAFAIYGISIVAIFPLQDGFFFSAKRQAEVAGGKPLSYPGVRVWGTIGFILPSLVLWLAIHLGSNTSAITYCAAGFSLLSFGNTFLLRKVVLPPEEVDPDDQRGWLARSFAPTASALRMLVSPKCRVLCIAVALAAGSSTVYHNFFGPYITKNFGVGDKWVGLIMMIGVVLEIGYTIALPWLIARFGGKWVITVGFAAMSLRMGLLAHYPSITTALVTQISHGLEIMAIFVVPVMIFDKLAGDSYRNSIQGAYSMLMAVFRVVGSMLAGFIASLDTVLAFEYGSVLALAAFLLVLFYFKEPSTVTKSVESAG